MRLRTMNHKLYYSFTYDSSIYLYFHLERILLENNSFLFPPLLFLFFTAALGFQGLARQVLLPLEPLLQSFLCWVIFETGS
jgi:hypothetical protein